MEFWGEGVWKNPALADRWEQGIEKIWNNKISGQGVKYKCYNVEVDVLTYVSSKNRPGPEGTYGQEGYNQIWVPDLKVGDLANTYSQYGLYSPDASAGVGSYSYGEYDPQLAQQYYQDQNPVGSTEGEGTVLAFVRNDTPIGYDAGKAAIWGTIPNTASIQVMAHEAGHLLGVDHDEGFCVDNLMNPYANDSRKQVYPRYFQRMLDPIGFACNWKVRSDVTMDAVAVKTYFPPALKGHNEFTLEEKTPVAQGEKKYRAFTKGSSDLSYDSIESHFTCNDFSWQLHNGVIGYSAELRYNFKEDLNTGGRLILKSTIGHAPFEEIQAITGCGRPNPSDLTKVDPINHHNFLYSLKGTNLKVTPYNNHFDNPVSCPATKEDNITEQYYVKGVVINGATKGAKAEHFPSSDLYGAKFKYDISILEAQPKKE